MKRLGLMMCLAGLLVLSNQVRSQEQNDSLKALLAQGPAVRLERERLRQYELVRQFYMERNYALAWNTPDHFPATQLVAQLERAPQDGLEPRYHLAILQPLLQEPVSAKRATALDLLLTDSFLSYARDLAYGQIHPIQLGLPWQVGRERINLAQLLQTSLASGTLQPAFASLAPMDPQYARLRKALADYSRMVEQKIVLKRLQKGDSDPSVQILQDRLFLLGDLVEERPVASTLFDVVLKEAVMRFQIRHGLKADGVVGPATIRELSVSVRERIGQIRANLERLRWYPDLYPEKLIRVNVPAFELHALDRGESVLILRAIVGKKGWSTPTFMNSEIRYIELNPDWDVPQQIVTRELLSTIRKDADYLARNHFVVFDDASGKREVVDSAKIDWSAVEDTSSQYHFMQRPGARNPLGKIKFEFPNNYGCYIHDTSTSDLFEKNDRALSHGCVRVEKPLELAGFLFQDSSVWTSEKIASEIDQGARSRIQLPVPVPIYFVYCTAWVDSHGVQFRRDLYGQDRLLLSLLRRSAEGNSN